MNKRIKNWQPKFLFSIEFFSSVFVLKQCWWCRVVFLPIFLKYQSSMRIIHFSILFMIMKRNARCLLVHSDYPNEMTDFKLENRFFTIAKILIKRWFTDWRTVGFSFIFLFNGGNEQVSLNPKADYWKSWISICMTFDKILISKIIIIEPISGTILFICSR